MNKKQLSSLSLLALCIGTLFGCGGGSDNHLNQSVSSDVADKSTSSQSNNNTQNNSDTGSDDANQVAGDENKYSQRGRVIDGYVSGAKVWLDLNNNGLHDVDEPSARSTDQGSYLLELSAAQRQCSVYVPTYVDVPVGAVDEDLGEVTKAYQLILPPSLEAIEDDRIAAHVTPLTTLLWQSLSESETFKGKSCAQLQQEPRLLSELLSILRQTTGEVIAHYNISEQQLFSDYIANQDEQAKQLAERIVFGLQASLKKRLELAEQYPDAHEIRVVHYQKTPLAEPGSNQLWYRDIVIFGKDNNTFFNERAQMDDSLQSVVFVEYLRNTSHQPWGTLGRYSEEVDLIKENGSDFGKCVYKEAVSVSLDGTNYELSNSMERKRDNEVQSCDWQQDFSARAERLLSITYGTELVKKYTQIEQRDGMLEGLSDWHSLANKHSVLVPQELADYFVASGYELEKTLTLPAFGWYKRMTDDSGEYRVVTERFADTDWLKTTYQSDGTYTKQCSEDGITWGSCQ
ncbi:hypothetical protein [Pseudoalteromonas sp. R3]|uniref:hypothetical protein n=1 Tax=Pseudoalteromonas sp. R3 TaxID=1709477 RepID=UPI0006B549BA|nr:hypothetical protein [Pseudoalteromonas sp. R3]AZZ97114.1 hypothetical protein ELR70_08100 [Pseudoalteromonas sp. R3]